LHCQNSPERPGAADDSAEAEPRPAQAQAGRLVDDLHRRAGRGQRTLVYRRDGIDGVLEDS
jgi:hypothetical protein